MQADGQTYLVPDVLDTSKRVEARSTWQRRNGRLVLQTKAAESANPVRETSLETIGNEQCLVIKLEHASNVGTFASRRIYHKDCS